MCGTREIYQLTTAVDKSAFCFQCINRKQDILIITDVSRSITRSVFEQMKLFQKSLVASVDISQNTNAIALMEFSKTRKVLISLDSPSSVKKADILSTIYQQDYENGPSTELADALDMAATEVFTAQRGDRADADNMVILFTDGWLYKSEEQDVAAAIGQLSAKAEVFVVASRGINSVITKIASEPKADHIFQLGGGGAVSTIRRAITPCQLPIKGI
ncbi:matrilin-3-like [Haliotis asinina]|uniref:matrilin-3-like n=1 Tax=Haliotis asinina TaxID=109174 RepID=UPI003531DE63